MTPWRNSRKYNEILDFDATYTVSYLIVEFEILYLEADMDTEKEDLFDVTVQEADDEERARQRSILKAMKEYAITHYVQEEVDHD